MEVKDDNTNSIVGNVSVGNKYVGYFLYERAERCIKS